MIKRTIRQYYQDKLQSDAGDLKKTWKTLNELMHKPKKDTKISELRTDDNEMINSSQIPNEFNRYFIELGDKLCTNISPPTTTSEDYFADFNCPANTLSYFKEISETEVLRLLHGLSVSKASGMDQISAKILKVAAPVIVPSLTLIFNQSIRTGIFPTDWKAAKVSPVYKSGAKHCISNYRLISIIAIVAIIMEKLIHNHIYEYVTKSNVLSTSQHGFRPAHSTVTALLDITNRWYQNMDIGQLNGVIFLYLKKAFDTVNHEILLKKLNIYGIRGMALEWLRSYLIGRTQYCQINGQLSDPLTVITGIHQGSALGPLLFLIYNDLPKCLGHTNINMFADDTQIETSSDDVSVITDKLNHDLENVSVWLSTNKLTLNMAKTEYMIIGSNKKLKQIDIESYIHIGGNKIDKVKTTKSLGLMIDESLTWNAQVDKITKKVNSGFSILRRLLDIVDYQTLITIYLSIIQPHFDYPLRKKHMHTTCV